MQVDSAGSSPYATGGGGVRLEHEYAATALASLLLGQPVDGLGDEFTPTQVAMQQGAWSPVDDVIIHGTAPGGDRTLRVACRRRPTIGKSDASTVALFADFLRVLVQHRESLVTGRHRLGLAVSAPFGPASELALLTDVARRQPDERCFAQALDTGGGYAVNVRTRLKNVQELVEAALPQAGGHADTPIALLTWQLLCGLFVIPLQLEGDVAPGRTDLVARLQSLTGDPARAEDLRLRLVEIATQGAIRAGAMTRPMLRSQLRSFGPLGSAPDFSNAQKQVAVLEAELRARTRHSVPVPASGSTFTLDRSVAEAQLVETIVAAPAGRAVIVHGEPDVGKSALALAAVDAIRTAGGAVLTMSLRDLPSSALQLRPAIGIDPRDLFAAAASAPAMVLLLDGGEVVQERDAGAVGAMVDSATAAGYTVVLVVRDDALETLVDSLRVRGVESPTRIPVSSLSQAEVAALVSAVPDLARLSQEPRTNWLLRRIGLVELLLKAAERWSSLPETLSSEAEVFATVWSSLVRQDERIEGGVAPDDRENALIEVARQLLSTNSSASSQGGSALASLRSDGILVSRGRSAAWDSGDRFASDVLRDFALTRLLLRHGLAVLADLSAPRWAVRATRLLAQARLAREATSTFMHAWAEVQSDFAALASEHGARWAELPWEALLTAGWAPRALHELTPALVGDADLRAQAIRTVMLRFSNAGASDAAIAAPLVAWLITTPGLLDGSSRYDEEPDCELIVRWLRGVARLDAAGEDVSEFRDLRARVRDVFTATEIDRSDKERLEALGLLGEESSESSVRALREIAREAPGFLAPVVESFDVATTLAQHDPVLLMDLADAFYIERPSNHPWRASLHDEGIRGHQPSGTLGRLAAWYLGPFGPLLQRSPRHGLRLINRMLDHGAQARLTTLRELDNRSGRHQSNQFNGVDIDVLGLGLRTFVGDSHVWSWYRGSSVGPYPCMSALMALELALDDLASQGMTPKELARATLQGAASLAALGVVFGFLVRHLEDVADELDEFLAHPDIWELEFGRVANEGHLHVQGKDPARLVNVDRRRWSPVELSARLVILAQERGDAAALERLRAVGRRLIEAAGGDVAPPHVQQWAAHLDIGRYSIHDDGQRRVLKVNVPESVMEAMQPLHRHTANTTEVFRLLHRYRAVQEPPYRARLASLPSDDELLTDYQTARRLEAELVADEEVRERLLRALAGVAAGIIQKASSETDVPGGSLEWAFQLLTQSAIHLGRNHLAYELSFSPDGADRQAALAIPLVLLGLVDDIDQPDDVGEILAVVREALCAGMRSPSIEVRHFAADGLRTLSEARCKAMPDGPCWHEILWSALDAGARTTVLGENIVDGARQIESIVGDVATMLAVRPDDELMLSLIAPAAIAALDAAGVESCIRDRTAQLRDPLIRSLARAACHWADNHYEWRNEYQAAFASALLRRAVTEDPDAIVRLARELTPSLDALGDYLHALTIVATHEPEVVRTLGYVWPQLMAIGIEAIVNAPERRRPRYAEKLISNLVPHPNTLSYMENIDGILRAARSNWLPMTAITDHIETWLSHARGQMFAIDALVGFLRSQPIDVQVSPGLDWIRALVVDDDGVALSCGFLLVSWLSELRDSRGIHVAAIPSYRAIVDALVLGNYRDAKDLQQQDE
jgi:hypothetical protein